MKHAWIALAALLLCCEDRTVAQAGPSPAPPGPKCLRERRMHVYGTYQAFVPATVAHADLPIDLTITECLEWEPK